jgi:hypothetical protein
MRFWSKNIVVLIAAATTFGAVGCSFPPSRIGFIEKIAKDNRKIARSTRAFRAAIISLKTGQTADAGQVRSAYQAMETTVKEVRAEMDAQSLPSSSSSAKAFLSAYKTFLHGQQNILDDAMLPIVKKVEEPGGSPATKWAFISDMLAKVSTQESGDYGALQQAQTAYASEHNYTVQTLETYLEAQKAGKQ